MKNFIAARRARLAAPAGDEEVAGTRVSSKKMKNTSTSRLDEARPS